MTTTGRRIKVLFFPAWYPHRGDSMAGLFVRYHAEAVLRYADVSVMQVVGEFRREGAGLEATYEVENGIPTVRIYYRKLEGKYLAPLINTWNYISASLKGYSLITQKAGRADVHHVHVLTRAGLIPWLLKLSSHIPYIISEHWSRYHPENASSYQGFVRKWLTKQVVRNAYAVCPVNEKLGSAMQSHGLLNNNYKNIFNVVDADRFSPSPLQADRKRLLHVSCFDEKAKNVKGLLHGFKKALESDQSLTLTLVGDGPDFEICKQYATESGLDGNVKFTGLLEGDALVDTLREHACLILFSNYENQPVVIIEAFACGLPVIATAVGGIPEMLAGGRGILLPVGDEKALTEAIISFISGAPVSAKEDLRQYAISHYSYEAVGKQFNDLYLAALQARG